jgi:hypothetical protein
MEWSAPTDAWDACGRGYAASFCRAVSTSPATVSACVVFCLIEGATAVWFLQALLGPRWNVADDIDGGIPAEVVFGCLMFAMFERKRAVKSLMQSVQSRQLPTGFFGIAGSIVVT